MHDAELDALWTASRHQWPELRMSAGGKSYPDHIEVPDPCLIPPSSLPVF